MPKITIIGQDSKALAALFKGQGYDCVLSVSPDPKPCADADLIVLDRQVASKCKEILKESRKTPKLALLDPNASAGPWLREPLCYPLVGADDKSVLTIVKRLLQENTERKTNVLLKDALQHMKMELAFFEELNRLLTSSKEIDDVLATIMRRVHEVTKAEAWAIGLIDEASGDLIIQRTGGRKLELKSRRVPPGVGIMSWVIENKTPAVIEDIKKDNRFSNKIYRSLGFIPRSVICCPLKVKGSIIGAVEIINKSKGEQFSEVDLVLLMRLMDHMSIAVERITLYQKLEELSVTDDLTSLFNSRYLHRGIESEIQRSERYSSSVSLIFMDIDYFKLVNDNHGHLIGSKVLVEVGQILINELRSIDIVSRYGGDEFVVILPHTPLNNAIIVAERMRKAIELFTFVKNEGLNLKLTASFGVATYPESAKSKEELLRIADESMYRVKHRTRNGVYAII